MPYKAEFSFAQSYSLTRQPIREEKALHYQPGRKSETAGNEPTEIRVNEMGVENTENL